MRVKASYNRAFYLVTWLGLLAGGLVFGLTLIVDLRSVPRVCDEATCRRPSGTRIAEDIVALLGLFLAQAAWRSRWERAAEVDYARQRAARGVGRVISLQGELRAENIPAVAPPVTLAHGMAWRSGSNLVTFGALLALTQLGFAGLLLSAVHDRQPIGFMDGVITECILIGFLALIFASLFVSWRQRIDVSLEGVTVRRLGRSHTLHWEDARLFALVGVSMYELSGEREIVRWVRARDTSAFRPTIPFAEYQRQMDGLLLLAAERTHLPLYDLSAEK